jgi:hypothetical protein
VRRLVRQNADAGRAAIEVVRQSPRPRVSRPHVAKQLGGFISGSITRVAVRLCQAGPNMAVDQGFRASELGGSNPNPLIRSSQKGYPGLTAVGRE